MEKVASCEYMSKTGARPPRHNPLLYKGLRLKKYFALFWENTWFGLDKLKNLCYNDDISNREVKLLRKDIMTLARFMNYILYTDKRPENISAARWCAMMTQAASMRPQPQKRIWKKFDLGVDKINILCYNVNITKGKIQSNEYLKRWFR